MQDNSSLTSTHINLCPLTWINIFLVALQWTRMTLLLDFERWYCTSAVCGGPISCGINACLPQVSLLLLRIKHTPHPTISPTVHDSKHMTMDTTVFPSKQRSPFTPLLPHHITIQFKVTRLFHSQRFSIDSFEHCPNWLWLVLWVIPSNPYKVFPFSLSHILPTYFALRYLFLLPFLYSVKSSYETDKC